MKVSLFIMVGNNSVEEKDIALWNPLWAILLSFIFTPVFGGIICGLNWRALGIPTELSIRWAKKLERSHG